MKTLSVPASECLYYDYPQAAAYFRRIGCTTPPQLGVLTYECAETKVSTIGWCSEENEQYVDLPAFLSFEDDDKYDTVIFIPMIENEVFIVDNALYMTIAVTEGLGIRRINLLFDESIVNALGILRKLPEMEYTLCKIYDNKQRQNLLGYYWFGTWVENSDTQTLTKIIAPVFGDEENILETRDLSEIEIVAAEQQESFIKNDTLWQIMSNPQYGTSVIPIMDISYGKQMLN